MGVRQIRAQRVLQAGQAVKDPRALRDSPVMLALRDFRVYLV